MKSVCKIVFGLLLWLLGTGELCAQGYEVSPTVPDFMDLSQACVIATSGPTDNPFRDTGVIKGRHTVLTTKATDPVTGDHLQILPDGVSQVMRLGNSQVGREAESITYHFIADRERPLLIFNFAVILQDPGHESLAQPRFVVQVLDKDNRLVEPCAEYNVRAGAGIDGFQDQNYQYSIVRWRNWTGVGIDLSAFAGEEVHLRFITYDCDYSAHFGYAYFYAECVPARLSLSDCQDDHFELSAPAHFSSYLWSNGQISRNSEWQKADVHGQISCEMTSVTGCHIAMFAGVNQGRPMPDRDTLTYDTICRGDSYTDAYFDLPAPETSRMYTTTLLDVRDCDASREVKVLLALNVIQSYVYREEWLCKGADYTEDGFDFHNVQPGTWCDTVVISNTGRCPSHKVLTLHVSEIEHPQASIVGDVKPCNDVWVDYRGIMNDKNCRYYWSYPQGCQVRSGMGLDVQVRYTSLITDEICLTASNGCGESKFCLPVDVRLSGNVFLQDSICTGLKYQKNGFAIPPQDETGDLVSINYGKSQQGCDSTTVLTLRIYGSPKVEISLRDSMLCVGRELTLIPKIDGNRSRKRVAAGDILCKDSTVVTSADFAASGKEACGVVFWVDQTGEHGWAADVWEADEAMAWGTGVTPPFKPVSSRAVDAMMDWDGLKNTQAVLNTGSLEGYTAIRTVTYAPGWYLPSAAQLRVLFNERLLVNRSFAIVGGKPLLAGVDGYWSSTFGASTHFWEVKIDDVMGISLRLQSMVLNRRSRGIRNF